jgi:hypothetical protein
MMSALLTVGVLALFRLVAVTPLSALSDSPLPLCGTLVVVVRNRDGFVIAADKRTYDTIRGDRDATQKIFPVGKYTALWAVGVPAFADRNRPGRMLYDADALAADWLRHRELSGNLDGYWTPLGNMLVKQLQTLFGPVPRDYWPAAQENNILFKLVVAHWNRQHRKPTLTQVTIYYDAGQVTVQAFGSSVSQLDVSTAGPYIFGNIHVWQELAHGNLSSFDGWRRDAAISHLFGPPKPMASISRQEAEAFALGLIGATSMLLPTIDASTNHVGPTADVALLSVDAGFVWLHEGVHTPEVPKP